MQPIIGITADFAPDPNNERTRGRIQLNWNYAQAVSDAGGMPLIIPPQADPSVVADLIDGLLIPGGGDFDASLWGEETHPEAELVAGERFALESALMGRIDQSLPVLGICYGCQLINVLRGGNLIQHLPDVIGHNRNQDGSPQEFKVNPDSMLGEIIGDYGKGKSYHHQAIGDVGDGLRVVARDLDGVVEAIEAADRPWTVGVQWHPERSDDDATKRLFDAFIQAAAAYKVRRKAEVAV